MAALKLKERGHIDIEGEGKFRFFEDVTDDEQNRKRPFFWAFYNAAGEVQTQSKLHFKKLAQAIDDLRKEISKRP
jgi:hypothetical protein